jgi:DNA-binding GntR family transcriptional regulator
MPDNAKQLLDLRSKAEKSAVEFNSEQATNAKVAELAQIIADLADIVHAHIYRKDDSGQP